MSKNKKVYHTTIFADGVEGYCTGDRRYAYLVVDGKIVMRINNEEGAWTRVQLRAWDYAHPRITV